MENSARGRGQREKGKGKIGDGEDVGLADSVVVFGFVCLVCLGVVDVAKPHWGGKANALWGDLRDVGKPHRRGKANARWGDLKEANALWGAKAVAKEKDEAKTQQHGGRGKREIVKKHSTEHSRQVQPALAIIGAKGMGRNASAAPEWGP